MLPPPADDAQHRGEDGLIVVNPFSIKGAGVEPADERPLPTLTQVHELAATVQPQLRALVLLAAFGGLRRGELLALTRRDVDLLHRTVTVRLQRQERGRRETARSVLMRGRTCQTWPDR